MSRDYYVAGPVLVKVRLPGEASAGELGLTSESIRISLTFNHYEYKVDDYGNAGAFGGRVPCDTAWMLATADINMTLVHFDRVILGSCVTQSMAGGTQGTMESAGTPMGGDGTGDTYHYISLNLIASEVDADNWHFPTAYLTESPLEIPIGSERSLIVMKWHAIPYAPFTTTEIQSASKILYDFSPDS